MTFCCFRVSCETGNCIRQKLSSAITTAKAKTIADHLSNFDLNPWLFALACSSSCIWLNCANFYVAYSNSTVLLSSSLMAKSRYLCNICFIYAAFCSISKIW